MSERSDPAMDYHHKNAINVDKTKLEAIRIQKLCVPSFVSQDFYGTVLLGFYKNANLSSFGIMALFFSSQNKP